MQSSSDPALTKILKSENQEENSEEFLCLTLLGITNDNLMFYLFYLMGISSEF